MNNAVVEVLREDLGKALRRHAGDRRRHGPPAERVLSASCQDEIRFGAEVHAIDQDADSVHGPLQDRGRPVLGHAATTRSARSRSPCCATIEVMTPFSREKQRAIRQLNYHASTKILFQVRERFWETDDGIFGGATVTDLPIRRMNYPTPDPTTTRGVLLACYTWGQDALHWGAMDEETRLEEALDDVAADPSAHPRGVRGRRVARLVRRPLGARRVRAVRARAADRAAGGHRAARGPHPLRRRALLAVPRLDPGRARVRHPRRARDPRGAAGLRGLRPRRPRPASPPARVAPGPRRPRPASPRVPSPRSRRPRATSTGPYLGQIFAHRVLGGDRGPFRPSPGRR